MNDIVDRLLAAANEGSVESRLLLKDAAQEIRQLRASLDKIGAVVAASQHHTALSKGRGSP